MDDGLRFGFKDRGQVIVPGIIIWSALCKSHGLAESACAVSAFGQNSGLLSPSINSVCVLCVVG